MLDEGNNLNLEAPEAPPPEESNNRTFLTVAIIFGALIFLTLVCGAVLLFWYLPNRTAQQSQAARATETANAGVAQQMTATAEVALWTPTPPPTSVPTKTNTPIPTPKALNSPTPLLAVVTTAAPTNDPATLAAMQTQLSQQMTSTVVAKGLSVPQAAAGTPGTPGTPTRAIPKTGFFDQVGLPGLVVLTLALIAVIFLSRRLRNAPTR